MGWTDPIDAYCERVGAGFWAEPANALTNVAFLAAAAFGYTLWRRRDVIAWARCRRRDVASLALIVLVAVIGLGSFLFHTFADRWSSLADVLPIAVFIHAYFALALYRFGGWKLGRASLATLLFFGTSFLAEPLLGPLLGGSAAYAPALAALLGISTWLSATRRPQGPLVLSAAAVFAVSLSLRTLDGPICARLPVGTHFLWHLLNALTLGLLLVASIREGPRPAKRRITA